MSIVIPSPVGVALEEVTPALRIHAAVRALRERAARTGGERRVRTLIVDDAPLGLWLMALVGSVVVGLRTSMDELAGQLVEVDSRTGVWASLASGLPSTHGAWLARDTDVTTLRNYALESIGAETPLRLFAGGTAVIAVDPWLVIAALTSMPPLATLHVSIAGHPNEKRRWLRASAEHWGVVAVPEIVDDNRPTLEQLPLLDVDGKTPAAPTTARAKPWFHQVACSAGVRS